MVAGSLASGSKPPAARDRARRLVPNACNLGACPQSSGSSALKPGFYVLKTDGGITAEGGHGSGEAAIGVVLKDPQYRDVDQISKAIGWAKNHHEAEYRALIEGLELARRHGIGRIRVFLDSALVVNTVNGDWKVDPEHLKGLRDTAIALINQFPDIKVCWVPREMNSEADALAGRALGRGARASSR
jgi:ribonuclease HI